MLRTATSRAASIGRGALVSVHACAIPAPIAADAVAGAGPGCNLNNGRPSAPISRPGADDAGTRRSIAAGIHTTCAASSSSSSSGTAGLVPELLPAETKGANGLVRGMSNAQRTAMLSALLAAEHGDDSLLLTRGGSTRRITAGQMDALFRAADADGSGRVDRDEFDKFLRSRFFLDLEPRHPMPMLHHVDDNNVDELHTKAGTSSSGVNNNVLYAVFLAQAIPFVGFGFMDNMIMIAAGEYIERSIGATLALSTMAAAGLGNLLSDIVGVATSNKIEAYAERAGFKSPVLTAAQESARGPRLAKVLGAIIGISVGCLLGMFPLLLHDADEVAHEKEREEKKLALARANKSVG